jgi:hypothetical protein
LFLNGPQWRTRRTLWPGKVAFSNYALVLFAGTLDSIFELAPTVRKLFGHLVGSARHVTTYDGPEVYDLTDLEFMRGHRVLHVWPTAVSHGSIRP